MKRYHHHLFDHWCISVSTSSVVPGVHRITQPGVFFGKALFQRRERQFKFEKKVKIYLHKVSIAQPPDMKYSSFCVGIANTSSGNPRLWRLPGKEAYQGPSKLFLGGGALVQQWSTIMPLLEVYSGLYLSLKNMATAGPLLPNLLPVHLWPPRHWFLYLGVFNNSVKYVQMLARQKSKLA